jgi:predicted ATPase
MRLDGIPLALELAAARGATLSLDELAAQLDRRFSRLSATRRDAVPRQRTLDASVRWSHDLLTASEQVAFRRLAVFSGWFRPADAVAIVGDVVDHGSDLVRRLVDQSLVMRRADGHLRLLETVDPSPKTGWTNRAKHSNLATVTFAGSSSSAATSSRCSMDPTPHTPSSRSAPASATCELRCSTAKRHDAAPTCGRCSRLANYFWYQGNLDEALGWFARAATNRRRIRPVRSSGGPSGGGAPATS